MNAFNLVQPHADLKAGTGTTIVRVPVADEHAVDGQQRTAARALEQRRVELIEVDGDGIGEPRLAGNGFQQEAMVGGILFELGSHVTSEPRRLCKVQEWPADESSRGA
jgi:hypothetical protein